MGGWEKQLRGVWGHARGEGDLRIADGVPRRYLEALAWNSGERLAGKIRCYWYSRKRECSTGNHRRTQFEKKWSVLKILKRRREKK